MTRWYSRPIRAFLLLGILLCVDRAAAAAAAQRQEAGAAAERATANRDAAERNAAERQGGGSLQSVRRLAGQGKYEEALTVLDTLLVHDPADAEAHAWKGNVLGALADQTKDMMQLAQYGLGAMQAFDRAIELDPNNITGRFGRGISNLMAPPPFGNVERGLEDLQKVVELDANHVEGHYYLGLAYEKKGEIAAAKAAFQATLRLAPGHAAAAIELEKLGAQTPATAPVVAPRPRRSAAFTHVTVIDGTGRPPQPNMTVVITGNRISTLGKTVEVRVPEDADVVDATGQFLIPGLWDMHVHIVGEPDLYFPLFLANGVTGIREMHGYVPPERWRTIKDGIASGTIQGPRVVAAGPIVDGPKPYWPGSIAVATASEGRQAVADLKKRGADFVKVYSFLPRDAYFAIADEATKQDIPFAGHVPLLVTALEASDLGQKSMEHLEGVWAAASSRAEEIDALRKKGDIAALTSSDAHRQLLRDYSDERAAALFAHLAKNATWQVPTLSVLHALASRGDSACAKDERLKYVPSLVQQFFAWQPQGRSAADLRRERDGARRHLEKALAIVARMHAAGVPLLAGTDAPYVCCFPGFTLHDELALLVQAGLTPMEALQAATLNPARYFGTADSLGTLAAGKLADMVLLEADPLGDIHNTRKIAAVVVDGRIYPRPSLEAMLADVAAKVAAADHKGSGH